jgi:alpha/beta superfamily hydrolase
LEEWVSIPSGGLVLEGYLESGRLDRGVVVAHPHPLYGGDMHNPVVNAIRRAYRRIGFATLRFNFRGTGDSTGHHDNGRGEQQDLQAAVAFLADRGVTQVEAAGYSFGAWVSALTVPREERIQALVMVSPPVGFIDFSAVDFLKPLRLVISGSRDEIAPPTDIRRLMPKWNPAAVFEVIDGADHFYGPYCRVLEDMIARHI